MDPTRAQKDAIGVYFIAIGLPIVIIGGCIGNALSFLVFSRKFFAKATCGLYLRALCVTDTMVCLVYICSFLARGLGVNVKNYSSVNCKIIWYLYYVPTAFSAMIETLVCFDRMLNISMPSKYDFMKRKSFVYLMISIIVTYNSLIYAPLLYFYDLTGVQVLNGTENMSHSASMPSCTMTSELYSNILSWFDMFNQIVVPFLIMLVCTVITLSKIYRVRKQTIGKAAAAAASNRATKTTTLKQRDLQFAFTSVCLCLIFFVLNIGSYIYDLLLSYNQIPDSDVKIGFGITFFFFIADYGVKFYLYLAVNRHFLAEFKQMLKSDLIPLLPGSSSGTTLWMSEPLSLDLHPVLERPA